ncbi:gag/pol protein [Cucumis melo var. makuwa]|uniref:Gag/pol protein n=1 Tax=Cucumis melo var. makuwa TaxID=1194695 RepID=A0A5A7TX06_CUCMM|nr:gag/pol protein [Cucumis melo var. makuwa]
MLALSQASYIYKIVVKYSKQNSKRGLLPFRHGVTLFKEQCLKTPQEDTHFNFQTDKDYRKSTSGSVFTLNEGVVVWRSIKQGCIVDSTMEVDYVGACEATKEVVWKLTD